MCLLSERNIYTCMCIKINYSLSNYNNLISYLKKMQGKRQGNLSSSFQ